MLFREIEYSKNYQQKKLNFYLFGKYLTCNTIPLLTSIFCVDNYLLTHFLVFPKNITKGICDLSKRCISLRRNQDKRH